MSDDTRTAAYRRRSRFQKNVLNPAVRAALRLGIAPKSYAFLETTGRSSGLARRTPVGNGLDGDTFWIVAEHGTQADYVRNLRADPRVRVLAGKRWRAGTAVLLPDDDTAARLASMPYRSQAKAVARLGTQLLTIRIDLDPQA